MTNYRRIFSICQQKLVRVLGRFPLGAFNIGSYGRTHLVAILVLVFTVFIVFIWP